MKKQINPTIKAHLNRGGFYLLLLIAVCAIPFALAQRNAPKPLMANPAKLTGTQSKAASQLLPYDVRGVPDMPPRPGSSGFVNALGRVPMPRAGAVHFPVPALSNQPSGAICPPTITESTSQSIVDGNSIACSSDGGVTTTDNSFWRAFDMNNVTG